MRLGTKVLLPLLPTVTLIMLVYAGWALINREHSLAPEARLEVQAYATALGSAFDLALHDVRPEKVQALLNEISRAPTVYGILVYDSTGSRTIVSEVLATSTSDAAPARLQEVLRTGVTAAVERDIDDQRVYSVLRALHGPHGGVTGALEVAQPLASIEAQKADVRRQFILNTMTLLTALSIAILWLVHRIVGRPMNRLAAAVRAVGAGNLAHRLEDDLGGGELAVVAGEFNAMARGLESARANLIRETEERLALEGRLRDAEKMAAIGNLAAGLAHEIAAPLSVISGRAEMMLQRGRDFDRRDRYLRIIVQEIERITTIVRNLLDFARPRALKLQRLELCTLIDTVLEVLEEEIHRIGARVVREEQRPAWARVDPSLLQQVITNVILNAVQAMEGREADRTLTVRVFEAKGDEPQLRLVVVEIEDTGPGISPEVGNSLFQPFFTTKERGTGLGLVISQRIIEEHGGRLEVRSSPRGATFRIAVPAWPAGKQA